MGAVGIGGLGQVRACPPYAAVARLDNPLVAGFDIDLYTGLWSEIRSHFSTVFEATGLSCMLYNNPIAYRVDVRPDQLGLLADAHPNLHAVKESSGDIRRFRELRGVLGDRLALFVGIDDMAVEGVDAGADGWIAGLVNALPEESIRLWDLALEARAREVEARERRALRDGVGDLPRTHARQPVRREVESGE